MNAKPMRICFFANMSAHANWREMFDRVEFYRIDIQLLRDLGHEVVIVGDPRAMDWSADLYYCWWWGHAPFPMIPAKLRRRPIIVTGAFDYATCRDELPGVCYLDRPAWQKIVLRAMLRLADANLFVSQYEYDEVTRNLTVRNPIAARLAIDTERYRPAPEAKRGDYFFAMSLLSEENAVRKGLAMTIEATALLGPRHAGTRLVIAGKHGNARDRLWARAKQLGISDRVEMPGMISEAQKLASYRECIAYVQPTLYEGFGHAIGEAVASGAAVVAAPRGAVPEVAGAFARHVDPHDPRSIATAMEDAADNPLTAGDRDAAHAWIEEHFSVDRRRRQLGDVIAQVTGT